MQTRLKEASPVNRTCRPTVGVTISTRVASRASGRIREVMMRRREFITLLGGVALPFPPSARAQKTTMPVIGFLDPRWPAAIPKLLRSFREGLKETGHAEGENVAIEYRWAEDQIDQLPGSRCSWGSQYSWDWPDQWLVHGCRS